LKQVSVGTVLAKHLLAIGRERVNCYGPSAGQTAEIGDVVDRVVDKTDTFDL
jgi:hypothetical protein